MKPTSVFQEFYSECEKRFVILLEGTDCFPHIKIFLISDDINIFDFYLCDIFDI